MTSDLPTAEWCLKEADLQEIYARYAEQVGPPGAGSGFRRLVVALRIAARVLDADALEALSFVSGIPISKLREVAGTSDYDGRDRDD